MLRRIWMLSCRVSHDSRVTARGCIIWAICALVVCHALLSAQGTQKSNATAKLTEQEEIYVARSVRESRVAPTAFCAHTKTGFKSDAFEDHYALRSIRTGASDGRMVNGDITKIGSGHACFGRTADPAILNFYLELQIGKTALKGIGDCRSMKSGFPEEGLIAWHCFLNLTDPLGEYVGGQLTSNTITSRKDLGLETDPPGYTQSSIATIRLWKRRAQRQAH
jgi:hypothetical protein